MDTDFLAHRSIIGIPLLFLALVVIVMAVVMGVVMLCRVCLSSSVSLGVLVSICRWWVFGVLCCVFVCFYV